LTEDRLVYRTKTSTGITVPSGDTMELVRDDTPGVLYSIEVITDNAYALIYLELDDYRTKGAGITAAELLMKGRTERSEDEFYALPRSPDGSYVVRFEPKEPIPYSRRLLVEIKNRIEPSFDIYGATNNQHYAPRGGLPAPEYLAYTGGGFIKNANVTSVHHNASAKFLRVNMDEYHSGIINTKPLIDNETVVGVSHPYAGISGSVLLFTGPAGGPMGNAGRRLVIGSPGEAALPEELTNAFPLVDPGDLNPNPNNWPGQAKALGFGTGAPFEEDSNSSQQIVVYASSAEDKTETEAASVDGFFSASPFFTRTTHSRIFIKQGDTIYFPGKVQIIYAWNPDYAGGAQWEPITVYNPGQHGAFVLVVQPGCPGLPRKITLGQDNEDSGSFETVGVPTNCIGIIENEQVGDGTGEDVDASGRFLVREATVKRKTLVSNT
jgi:hypothetical protein